MKLTADQLEVVRKIEVSKEDLFEFMSMCSEPNLGQTASMAREILASRQLMQIMFDPENQPPQLDNEDAWKQFLDIGKGGYSL